MTDVKEKDVQQVQYHPNGSFETLDGWVFPSAGLAWEHAHELNAKAV